MRELTPARRLRRFLRDTPTAIGGRKEKRSRGSPSRGSGGGRGGEHSGKEVLLVSFFSDQGFERRRKRKSINKSLRSHGEGAPVLDSLSFSRPCPSSHGQPPRRRSPSSRRAWSERLWLLRAGPVSLRTEEEKRGIAINMTNRWKRKTQPLNLDLKKRKKTLSPRPGRAPAALPRRPGPRRGRREPQEQQQKQQREAESLRQELHGLRPEGPLSGRRRRGALGGVGPRGGGGGDR